MHNKQAKQRLTQCECVEIMRNGYRLLNTMDVNDTSVSVLDFVNPYSFLLNFRSPTGDYSFIDKNRNFRKSIHLPVDTVFQASDWLMMPKVSIDHPKSNLGDEINGRHTNSAYVREKESDYWCVYSRRHWLS